MTVEALRTLATPKIKLKSLPSLSTPSSCVCVSRPASCVRTLTVRLVDHSEKSLLLTFSDPKSPAATLRSSKRRLWSDHPSQIVSICSVYPILTLSLPFSRRSSGASPCRASRSVRRRVRRSRHGSSGGHRTRTFAGETEAE